MVGVISVLGAGGHGRDIASTVGRPVLFYDDNPELGYPPTAEATGRYLIGVNDPKTRALLDRDDLNPAQVTAWTVLVGDRCDVAPGVVIAHCCVLANDVILGRHTHINLGCNLVRCTLGDYVTVAPGVNIAGDVTIGDRVFIGIGANIANLVTVGDDAVIGAGAIVLHDVEPGATVVGVH